jgi:methylaspartate mutase sigma subunit
MSLDVHIPSNTLIRRDIIVSSLSSDSHTWNLIYLQLVLEELGYRVHNLGACVPEKLLVEQCVRRRPDLLVLSSVNGHGYQDGLRAIRRLRAEPGLHGLPVVIGGKLGTAGPDLACIEQLIEAGFDGVFENGPGSLDSFRSFVRELPAGHRS